MTPRFFTRVLFNIYVNDLRGAIADCGVVQYSDDT